MIDEIEVLIESAAQWRHRSRSYARVGLLLSANRNLDMQRNNNLLPGKRPFWQHDYAFLTVIIVFTPRTTTVFIKSLSGKSAKQFRWSALFKPETEQYSLDVTSYDNKVYSLHY